MDTQMVLDFLSKLGEQITTTAQQVFEIYTRQAFVNGITDLILFVVFSVIVFLGVKGEIWSYKKEFECWQVLFAIVVLVFGILGIICLT